MTVEEAIRALLVTMANLTALVSTRIYLAKLPQTPTYPCVRVSLVSELSDYHLRGGAGIGTARVQVDNYAREVSGVDPYALAVVVADAINGDDAGSGLSGWQGGIGSPPFEVLSSLRLERRQSYDPDELRIVMMSQDYRVTFRTL